MSAIEGALEYRPAATADANWLADTFLTSLRVPIEEVRGHWDEGRERDQFLQQLRLSDTHLMLLDGLRVGFYTAWPEPDHLFLGTLCLTPENQNRGFGAAAMHAIRNQAKGLPVHFSVLKSNAGARRFYERLGSRWVSASKNHDHFVWSV
jgi:ribosomal protein S18 acetylase RimI-like enzyme